MGSSERGDINTGLEGLLHTGARKEVDIARGTKYRMHFLLPYFGSSTADG